MSKLSALYTNESAVIHRFENGMTVVLEPLPHLRSVTAGIWIRVGSANEPAELNGVSHFLEHLLFKGTTRRTSRRLMEEIESRGGHINAFTGRDFTCVYVRMLDTHVAEGLDVLADIIQDSQLNDFEKERNVILEEIASGDDVPEELAHDLFMGALWPNRAIGRPIAGSEASVSGMGLEEVRDHYRGAYTPENLIISLTGNFDSTEVLDQLHALFQNTPRGERMPSYEMPEFAAGIQRTERDIAQSHICFGFPSGSMTDDRRFQYDMLSSALGGGSTSRLFDRIRESEGLAYSIYTFNSCYLLSGILGVYAAVAPENLEKTLDLAFEELRKMRDNPLSADELALNREQLKGGFLMALESTYSRMTRLAKSIFYRDRIVPVDEVIAGIDGVTAEDLQALSQELLQADRCSLTVLGPGVGRMPKSLPL